MFVRQFPKLLLIVIASLLGATACGPATGVETGAEVSSAGTESPETATPADAVASSDSATATDATASSDTVTSSEAVTATVQIEDNAEQARPEQSGTGAASEEPQTDADDEEVMIEPGPLVEYIDNTYSFIVS